jgi:DNA-binding response OmpR family regulator
MQVLVVEDERRMAELLRRGLEEEGHHAVVARDGEEGFAAACSAEFDVIVLDIGLPRLDGIAVARRLRERRNQTPLLMLTARDTPGDVIRGLDSGADDYLTKPFSFEVFLAHLRAVSRRGAIPRPVLLQVGGIQLDPAAHTVSRDGNAVALTPREYALLELLMRHRGRVVERERILTAVWGYHTDVTGNTIEAFVRLLRQKVDTGEPKLIHTVRGIGYAMREPQQ